MSSTYWKREIVRYSYWLQRSSENDFIYTFKESVEHMKKAIEKYEKQLDK